MVLCVDIMMKQGHCKNEEIYICEVCKKKMTRLKDLYFLGGSKVCQYCRDKAWEDVME